MLGYACTTLYLRECSWSAGVLSPAVVFDPYDAFKIRFVARGPWPPLPGFTEPLR